MNVFEKRKQELEAKLSGKQRQAALLCVERELAEDTPSRLTLEEIADKIGYTRKQLWQWRTQNRAFIDYVNLICDDFFDSKRVTVYRRLMGLIDPKNENVMPSVKAIDLYFRRCGLLVDRQIVENRNTADTTSTEDISADIKELDHLLEETNKDDESS